MQARNLTIRLIRLAMAAALLLPCLLFCYASWVGYRSAVALADERLLRSLDVQREEALKTFQLIDLTLDNATGLIAGMSDQDIRNNEPRLYQEFRKFTDAIPVVQSVWIYDKDGVSIVSSWLHPPPSANFSDRDFYQAHLRTSDAGTYYGQVNLSQFNGQPFFTVSRRLDYNGVFAGVLEISLLPSNFFQFYKKLAYTEGMQFGMLRNDGLFLARYPEAPAAGAKALDEHSGFRRTIAQHPEGGLYTALSPVDGVERRFAVHRFGDTPVYLTAGIATATIRHEWLTAMSAHLIFGIPVTLILFLTLFAVLRRTRRLYREIDRRSIAEDSLRQSQKLEAIGHLIGGVAHDFNNLLTIIIGNLETAQRQLAAPVDAGLPKLTRRIDNAMHGAQRAATLTKRLLAFSRQQPLSPAALDVNRLLNGLSDFLRRAIGEEISLEIVGGGGLWPVEADPAELESAILNLAVNARDAMPEGGKLTIEASNSYLDEAYCARHADIHPGQYVQLSVTDTGSGMTKDVIDRAFEPFFTTKASGHGTGLGLSQVYGFVKQSGGHLKIYSEIGEGSTVKIYLRRFAGNAVAPEEARPARAPGRPGECILVVEDDTDVRTYVTETLAGLGYDVLDAAGGEDALRLIDQHKAIALLLTDVVMPGMNGRKLAEQARARRPGLKVLFMTGYSRNAIVHQGRLDPGVDLIQKPLTSDQLAATVRRILDA